MKKESQKQMKCNKGITLIALVVTIIVLLILAGITITTLFSQNGILMSVQKAVDESNRDEENTKEGIENLTEQMQDKLGKSEIEQGKLVSIEEKFANYRDNTSNESVPIPGGYCVVKNSETTGEKNTIKGGLVISDLEEDTLDNNKNIEEKQGNQFVWVPVLDANTMYGIDSEGNKHGKLYEFGVYNRTTSLYDPVDKPKALNWAEENGIMKIDKPNDWTIKNREPDILLDPDYGDVSTGAKYYNQNGIKFLQDIVGINADEEIDESQKNQNILDKWENELKTKFNEMIESVKKYKGFYIGRYETGDLKADKNNTPVVKRGKTVKGVQWYYIYQTSKRIAGDNKNVTSSMIWGCQVDRTLDWIAQTNTDGYSLLVDGRKWGNYSDSTEETTKNGIVQTSGTSEKWKKNNIYDLAGNVEEWTLEAGSTTNRTARGGSYKYTGKGNPGCARDEITTNNYALFGYLGSRCTLYIN